jgi:cell division protein FtsQ
MLAAALVGLLVFLGGFWLWFRDSPFVSISRVQITGLSGPGIPQIRQALRGAAMRMSSLEVDMTQLRAAVDPYPDVKSLTVQTQFPHGVVIRVTEEVPIAEISLGGRTLAISRDGTLLPATPADSRLPLLPVAVLPAGNRLTQAGPRAALAVLAAAPYSFLRHVESVSQSSQNGLVAQLRHGPQVRFGDTTQLHAKWAAALAVLGDPTSQGAPYIDVTYPGRPAAGAPTSTTTAATTAATTTATTAASTTTTTPGADPGTTAPTTSGPG